jgi:tetratricopeptide (TPR) repeat protein
LQFKTSWFFNFRRFYFGFFFFHLILHLNYKINKDYKQAIACAFEALEERPDYPDAYLSLHDIYFDKEDWEKCIEWGEQGLKKNPPRNFIVSDPSSYTWRPALSLSYAYWSLGEFEKAMPLFNYAKKLAPNTPFIKETEKSYIEGLERKDYIDKLLWLIKFTEIEDKEKVEDLVKSSPISNASSSSFGGSKKIKKGGKRKTKGRK